MVSNLSRTMMVSSIADLSYGSWLISLDVKQSVQSKFSFVFFFLDVNSVVTLTKSELEQLQIENKNLKEKLNSTSGEVIS